MATAALWLLERYARLVPDRKDALPVPDTGGKSKKGSWMHYTSSNEADIQLALLESNHFMISHGSHIYESFSLWDAHKWIKGVSKGDSILFIYQLREESRRFRIKFAAQPPSKTSLQACNDCIAKLSLLVPIREMGSLPSNSQSKVVSMEESQIFSQVQESILPQQEAATDDSIIMQTQCGENIKSTDADFVSISNLVKDVCIDGESLGKAYVNTNFPVGQLGDFIRLCLTDSNFPAFVGAVEKELHKMTN